MRIMTYNIKNAHDDGDWPSWRERRDGVARVILDRAPDLLGVQEAFKEQVDDLDAPGWPVLDLAVLRAVTEAAHTRSLRVSAHVTQPGELAAIVGEQIDNIEVFDDVDFRHRADFFDESLSDYSAGRIAVGVGDSRVAVAAFEGYIDLSVFCVELCAPVL